MAPGQYVDIPCRRDGRPDRASVHAEIVNENFSDHYEAYQRTVSRPFPVLVLTAR
jgi:hypothetical protein